MQCINQVIMKGDGLYRRGNIVVIKKRKYTQWRAWVVNTYVFGNSNMGLLFGLQYSSF